MSIFQTVNNLKLHVQIGGEGLPILLLHGWGGSSESMRSTAVSLAEQGFQTHTLDLPGFGKSDLPPEPWDIRRYAELVAGYIDTAGLGIVSLIGHSFGGRISIYLGAEYPACIKQIVLVDSAGVRLPLSLKMRLYYLARSVIFRLLRLPGIRYFELPVRQWLRGKFGSEDYLNAGALAETFKRVVDQDLVPLARRIQAPTLLIWGDQDQDTPLSHARILEKAIPNAGLVIFEGAGHFSYLDRPLDFARIVTNFLRSK